MKLTNEEYCYLYMFDKLVGIFSKEKLAVMYKEKVKDFIKENNMNTFDKRDIRTVGDIFALMEYGSILAKDNAESEDDLIYQIDIGYGYKVHTRNEQDKQRRVALINQLAQQTGCDVVQENVEKSLLMNLIFLVPNKGINGTTDHSRIKGVLGHFELPYKQTTPAFSYDID